MQNTEENTPSDIQESQSEQMLDQMDVALEQAQIAMDALENAFHVQATKDVSKIPEMNGYLTAAMEALDIAMESQQSGFKAVINKVVAMLMRMFEYIIDFMQLNHRKAKEYIVAANTLIAAVKDIPSTATTSKAVTNYSTMTMLSYEGNSPRYIAKELDSYYAEVINSRRTVPTDEINAFVTAYRSGKPIDEAFEKFHAKLKDGLLTLGEVISADSKQVFAGCKPDLPVYSTKRLIGDRFIFGQISEISKRHSFDYSCVVKKDKDSKLRVNNFNALRPNDISLVARAVRSFCEDILRNEDIEGHLYKAMRDINSLRRSNPTHDDVTALRTIASTAQSLYLVRLRQAMLITEYVLYYLRDSVKCYN